MATIKDIAQLAGVSHGTVSNVLNKRGNVSAEKIELVLAASEKVGYKLNPQAQSLRKGHSNTVSIIIPYELIDKYLDMYKGFALNLNERDLNINLIFLNKRKELKNILDSEFSALVHSVVVLGIKLKEKEISNKKKTNLYVFDSPIETRNTFCFQINYDKLTSDFKKEISNNNFNRVEVLALSKRYERQVINAIKDSNDQSLSFRASEVSHGNLSIYFDILNSGNQDTLIICLNKNIAFQLLEIADWLNISYPLNIICLTTENEIPNADLKFYELNYKKYGFKIAEQILIDNSERKNRNSTIVFEPLGFTMQKDVFINERKKSIRFLTIESPTTKAIQRIIPKYSKLSKVDIDMEVKSYEELKDLLLNNKNYYKNYDLIRIDMGWLSMIGKTIFKDLSQFEESAEIAANLSHNLSHEFKKFEGAHYAFPLDASVQALFYRKDLFDDILIQRRYFEEYKENLVIPSTFEEFDTISNFFDQSKNEDSPTLNGSSRIFPNSPISTAYFLPRLKEKLNDSTYVNESFEEILEETLIEFIQHSTNRKKAEKLFWQDLAESLSNGETAMEILFSNYAFDIFKDPEINSSFSIGSALVPGGKPLLGGGVIGITESSENTNEVLSFLTWLYSPSITKLINHLGGFIYSKNLFDDIDLLEISPWLINIKDFFNAGSRQVLGDYSINYHDEKEIENLIKLMADSYYGENINE